MGGGGNDPLCRSFPPWCACVMTDIDSSVSGFLLCYEISLPWRWIWSAAPMDTFDYYRNGACESAHLLTISHCTLQNVILENLIVSLAYLLYSSKIWPLLVWWRILFHAVSLLPQDLTSSRRWGGGWGGLLNPFKLSILTRDLPFLIPEGKFIVKRSLPTCYRINQVITSWNLFLLSLSSYFRLSTFQFDGLKHDLSYTLLLHLLFEWLGYGRGQA